MLETAQLHDLQEGLQISIPTAPLFLATKLLAYENRAGGDLLGSHDLEDVITVVAGREEVVEELTVERDDVQRDVVERVTRLLADDDFIYAIEGALPNTSGFSDHVYERFNQIAGLS